MQSEKEFLKGFEECFESIQDKRQKAKVVHPLIEVLFVIVTKVVS